MAKEVNVKLNLQGVNEAEKALNKFGLTVDDLKENEVEPLSFAIGELEDQLYSLASAGKQNSAEFKQVAAEVGRMKKVIVDVDLAVDGLAMTTSQQLSGSMMGVASGFELAQGAMGAFGAESEQVEAALLKVQSASAIADGLQGIKESVASFKALKNSIMATTVVQKAAAVAGRVFNAVMKANPIGLIITAVAALVAGLTALINNFRAVTDWLGITDSESEKYTQNELKRTEALQKAFKKASDEKIAGLDHEINKRKANGEDTYKIELKKHKAIVAFTKEQMRLLIQQFKLKQQLGQVDKEYYDSVVEQGQALMDTLKSSQNAIEIMEIEHQKKIQDTKKASYEKSKAREDKRVEDEKKRKEELRKLEEEFLKFKEDANNSWADEAEALDEAIYQAGLSAREKEQSALDTYYFDLIERARQHGLDVTALEEEQRTKNKELQDGWRKEDEDADKEARDKKKAADDKEIQDRLNKEQASVAMASDALDAINGLVQAFAGDNEKAQRRAFVVDKAVNIAKAVMNTATGVSQALASSAPPLSFVQAGITAAAGAAQIATIAKTKFQTSGGGSTSVPTPPTGGAARPANFNIIGNSGTNQLAESLGNQTMKAYVVGSEVTTQQSLDRNRVKNASI
jgi:hypothetical protein